MTLVYRQEYRKTLGAAQAPEVLLPQEWLARVLPAVPSEASAEASPIAEAEPYQFLAHCTEKTNEPASIGLWQQVFARMGLKLQVLASGCCGMSGTYGHETRNLATSQVIYQQSWQPLVARHGQGGRLLADGYSCRSQVKRQEGQGLQHPLQALLEQLRKRPLKA